jgi:CRISPR system Cascade subunit CasB
MMETPSAGNPLDHVPKIAAVLGAEHFPTAHRAKLKRMALDGPAPLAFHRFMLEHVDEAWHRDDWMDDWRTLVCALALQRDGGHDPGRPFGRALAQAGYSEARLERLLAADGDTRRTLALRAARQLAAKGLSANWRDFGNLLFSHDPEPRERANRRLARDFYRAQQEEKQ